ncbi:MFS transporter [Bifidobacterium aquikefiri]|uniref:MFS transporter n=1 Tax=Bifidobacterium aquikefiri TaxID=1653207 RepID=A0A261GBA4_9BIFI|nr:MFS transporter [Bifidobacterium aquikefiri]OZG68523.1 MFS transporter [Bifidobacterium aquikefiri]
MSTVSVNNRGKADIKFLIPVMASFFVMGFVDLVGTATNYIKPEFHLSNSQTNLFTSMVFFWFLIFSVPTSVLMNKIGRRRTVLLSIVVTSLAMLLPVIAYIAMSGTSRYVMMIVSFSLLGIGNALMQVSLNPLLTVFVGGDRLASTLTTGQFVKAIASFFAPIIAGWGAAAFNAWWILYAVYLVVGVVIGVALAFDKVEEPLPDAGKATILSCFKLLGKRIVLLCFLGIICHVGIDVGVNAQAPRILMEHTDVTLEVAGGATSVYFAFRTIGCLTGGLILHRLSNKFALRCCGVIMLSSAICYAIFAMIAVNPPQWLFYLATALIGFGNSNVFSLFLSHALLKMPKHQNEISGLMMMGLLGGAIFPPIMGTLADHFGQIGSISMIAIGALYVLGVSIFYRLLQTRDGKEIEA